MSNKHETPEEESLPVNLLRQLIFCPRIPFIREVMGVCAPEQVWMKQGDQDHEAMERRLQRRIVKPYGFDEAVKHRRCSMRSAKLGIHGIADWILEGKEHLAVIEYKSSKYAPSRGARIQLAAYGMLAEEHFDKDCPHLFFLWGEKKRKVLALNDGLRQEVLHAVERLQSVIDSGIMPYSSATAAQCTQCEHLNVCNDRF